MLPGKHDSPARLEDLPNIGRAIAADLRAIGIFQPLQLAGQEPLAIYLQMAKVMGQRHDPCVLYVLLAVVHFLDSGEAVPWWKFTGQGKKLLTTAAGAGPK